MSHLTKFVVLAFVLLLAEQGPQTMYAAAAVLAVLKPLLRS